MWKWMGLVVGIGFAIAVGCSASGDGGGSSGTTATGVGGGHGGDGAGGLNIGGEGQGGAPPAIGTVEGTVLAPEGTIPISGALLYLALTPPGAIPDGVFCDRCVELDSTTPHTFSNPDGTFTLPVYAPGDAYLVVQKGQFRRVRPITTVEGTQSAPADMTTLPGAMDKANGDDIPRMAVLIGAWDDIGESLEKLGMQSGSFDRFEFSFPPDPNSPFNPDLLMHTDRINDYHIVFIPCDSSDGVECNYSMAQDAATQQNLQQWVAAGGKLYVTDYSYDYIALTWPEYVTWEDQTQNHGSACLTSEYDAPAQVEDPDMADWLAAQGITSFTLEKNWTMVDQLHTVPSTDVDGNPVDVTPKNWVSGNTNQGLRPSTISFERSCGRVLFSTYHTEGTGGAALLAQEKALLYVLLEVAVCVDVPVPR